MSQSMTLASIPVNTMLSEAIGHELVSGLHMLTFQSYPFQPTLLLSGLAGHELVSGPSLYYKLIFEKG